MIRAAQKRPGWRRRFVRTVWATHNDSPAVRAALRDVLAAAGERARGLNVGAGETRWGPRFVHVDLEATSATDVIADGQALPFRRGAFDLVMSQETVEHLADPFVAVAEMGRVLAAGGWIYLQAPFIIGYHPGPEDHWRFTRSGMSRLLERAGVGEVRVESSVAAGTGFYRILVEFLAVGAARLVPAAYLPVKGLASLLCFPLKWLDPLLRDGPQADRIAGGYFAVGRKPS